MLKEKNKVVLPYWLLYSVCVSQISRCLDYEAHIMHSALTSSITKLYEGTDRSSITVVPPKFTKKYATFKIDFSLTYYFSKV